MHPHEAGRRSYREHRIHDHRMDRNAVRQIVERVTVLSADEILVRIKGGAEIKQAINR